MKHTFSILLFFCTSIFSAYGYHRAEIRFNTANNRSHPDSFIKRGRHYNTAEYSNELVHVGVHIGTSSHHDYYHEPRPAVTVPATTVKIAENAPAEYWFVVGDRRQRLSEEEFKAFTASPTAHNSVVVENSVTYNTADLIEISNECIADMTNVEYENHTDFFASVTDAVQQTLNLDVSSERPHELPQETREFLRHHEYDTALLEKPLIGTALQHVLHDQCLSIFDNVALRNPIAMVPTLAPLYSALLDFGWAAITCNIVGEMKSAFHIIKLCLPLLDQTAIMSHARYVGTTARDVACRSYCGLGKGVDNFIAILRDPKTFLHSCCKTINAGGQGLLRMTAQCAKLDMLVDMAIQDPVKATVQLEAIQKEVEPIVRHVQVQFEQLAKMSVGDIAEHVTTSIVEGLLFRGLVKLCTFTINTVPVLIETIRDGVALDEIVMTAEGIPVRVPAKAFEIAERAEAIVKVEKATAHSLDMHKMRGKGGSPHKGVVEATHTKPLNKLSEKELIGIKNVVVQGHGSLPKKIVLDNYKHYLQPELKLAKTGRLEGSGWHHDIANKIEKKAMVNGHKIEIIDKEIRPSGIYRFNWGVVGMGRKRSTFFPSHWSRETVQKKIIEAFKYARRHQCMPGLQENGYFSLTGFTKEGIEIKMIINADGKLITAYPHWVK